METFANIMFTEIIPFYFVLDKKFIKIFTLQFLEVQTNQPQGDGLLTEIITSEHDSSTELDGAIDTANNASETRRLSNGRLSGGGENERANSMGGRRDSLFGSDLVGTQIRLTANGNQIFTEQVLTPERARLQELLTIRDNEIVRKDAFVRPWYPAEKKFLKQKLGALYFCMFKGQTEALVRVMKYDRISSYQIEAFFVELARIHLYKLQQYIVVPLGIHVNSSNMEISVVMPELVSLHDMIHNTARINHSDGGELSLVQKIAILVELAKVMGQMHSLASPIAHGNLNSHNVFVEFDPETEEPKIRIGELEMSDFKKYANMFYAYRCVSVWSPPECLRQQKKRAEPTW